MAHLPNKITGVEALPGDDYGDLKLQWDIPTNFFYGGLQYQPPVLMEYFENMEGWDYPHINGWTPSGWGPQIQTVDEIPGISMPFIMGFDEGFSSNKYVIDHHLLGYPNPMWTDGVPPWEWNIADFTYTYIDLGSREPLYFMERESMGNLIDVMSMRFQLLDPCSYDVDFGLEENPVQTLAQFEVLIPAPEAQQSIAEDWPNNVATYVQLKGLRWVPGAGSRGGRYVFDFHPTLQSDYLNESYTDPQGSGLGFGEWSGNSGFNQLYAPKYGQEEIGQIAHQIDRGEFHIYGRKGWLPHNINGLTH